jgi:SET domain-containing protein
VFLIWDKIDLEAHGGLYVLHSHINHSCAPNLSIRHLDQRTTLSRITVIARRDIEAGEELFISYVNPELPLERRRQQLMEWGFGKCTCSRCVTEEQDPARQILTKSAVDDLERELKAGLGVM